MLINLYIEVPDEQSRNNLESWLYSTDYTFYDATSYDSLCSGPCKVKTVSEVKQQLEAE